MLRLTNEICEGRSETIDWLWEQMQRRDKDTSVEKALVVMHERILTLVFEIMGDQRFVEC